jgi:hypothetical protein
MKKLQKLIAYYKNINPCGEESTCIVRAACHMRTLTPWLRSTNCPDYIKYTNRRDKRFTLKYKAVDWFWIVVFISMFIFIFATFVLGVIGWIEILFY